MESGKTMYQKEYGFSLSLINVFSQHLQAHLKQYFPSDWQMILSLVFCRIAYQSPIKNMSYFIRNSYISNLLKLADVTDKSVSSFLQHIGSMRVEMVTYMKNFVSKDDSILVDATDIVCNSKNIFISKMGYNSDMNFQSQFCLLYLYSATNHEPFFYRLIPGNIADVSTLKNTMIERELTNALYISDKGFYSESNIEQLNALQMKYIIPLRRNNSCISYNLLSNITISNKYFKFRDRYVCYTQQTIDKGNIYIYLNVNLKEEERVDYLNRIAKFPERTIFYISDEYAIKESQIGYYCFTYQSNLGVYF